MSRSSRYCQSLNLQTTRVKRSRPSGLAIALALLLTMAVVFLLSLGAKPEAKETAAAPVERAQLQMEGMEAAFLLSGRHDDILQARFAAAKCAQTGGAGLILPDGDQFAVVQEGGDSYENGEAPVIRRRAEGLTLEIDAQAQVISALKDGLDQLYTLVTETAALAENMEGGGSDERTVSALLNLYRTRIEDALSRLPEKKELAPFRYALESSLERLNFALNDPDPGKMRLIHAAGKAEWINLLEELLKR